MVGKQALVTKHIEGLSLGDLSPAQVLEACHYVYEASFTHGDGSRDSGNTQLVAHLAANLPEVLTFHGVPLNPADVFAVQNVLERGGAEGRSFCLDLEDSGIHISGLRALVGLSNINTYRYWLQSTSQKYSWYQLSLLNPFPEQLRNPNQGSADLSSFRFCHIPRPCTCGCSKIHFMESVWSVVVCFYSLSKTSGYVLNKLNCFYLL